MSDDISQMKALNEGVNEGTNYDIIIAYYSSHNIINTKITIITLHNILLNGFSYGIF